MFHTFSKNAVIACAATAALCLGLTGTASAEVDYNATFYGHFGLDDAVAGTGLNLTGFNNEGDIVGTAVGGSNNNPSAFVYKSNPFEGGGTTTSIPMFDGGTYSFGYGINDNGIVVGFSDGQPTSQAQSGQGFSYDPGSSSLGTIGTLAPGEYVGASGINDDGYVVGETHSSSSPNNHAYLYNPHTNVLTDLGTLPQDTYSVATLINSDKQIAGTSSTSFDFGTYRMFYYANGNMTNVDAMVHTTLGSNVTSTHPTDINDSGQVLGYAIVDPGNNTPYDRPFVYDPVTNQVQLLGDLTSQFVANGMNEDATVVGSQYDGTANHAVIYDPFFEQTTDLNTEVNLPPAAGWSLTNAVAINDQGQILAYGQKTSDPTQNGAFLLSSVYDNTVALSPSDSGDPVTVSVNGGQGVPGGVTATFPNASGSFTAYYINNDTPEGLEDFTAPVTFALATTPSGKVQYWYLEFDGTTTGATSHIILTYDPSMLLPGTDEASLAIYHYTDGAWQPVDNMLVDTLANTISFDTDSFSPFALGMVPEPASAALVLLGLGGLMMLSRRRRAL